MFGKIAIMAAASMAIALTPASAQDADRDTEMTKGQQELAKLLEGRVAGEPTDCVRTTPSRGFRVIDETALVYKSGDTVWVNYTAHPETLDDSDALLIRKYGASANRLCRLDNVTTFDRYSGFFSGVVFLEDFVPYRRIDTDAES